jgi:hypothetical protein
MGVRPRIHLSLAAVLLAACPTVDLGDSPPDVGSCRLDPLYYEDVIWPGYLAPTSAEKSCVSQSGCHSAESGRSALRLDATAPIDHTGNYQIVSRFLNCSTPSASSLLTKPLAAVDAHGGGDIFADSADPAVSDFLAWFP